MLAVAELTQTSPLTTCRSVSAVLRWVYNSGDEETIGDVEAYLYPRLLEFVRAKWGHDYRHIGQLRMWVIAGLPTGLHKGRGVEKMIMHYLGHPIGVRSIQRDLQLVTAHTITLEQVNQYQHVTGERLDVLDEEARRVLKPMFQSKGWL
jgi:hypothetical protein